MLHVKNLSAFDPESKCMTRLSQDDINAPVHYRSAEIKSHKILRHIFLPFLVVE